MSPFPMALKARDNALDAWARTSTASAAWRPDMPLIRSIACIADWFRANTYFMTVSDHSLMHDLF
jgi:hypothetical protein